MEAAFAVHRENFIGGIKGFMKLRKTFITLNALKKLEAEYLISNRPYKADNGPDSDIFTHSINIFVHNSVNTCLGALLLGMAVILPTLSRLLSTFGFQGDRNQGLQMLWSSTCQNSIYSGIASLVLLAYYNHVLGFSDILPSEEKTRQQCYYLLFRLRKCYPESCFWRLEEARYLSNARNITRAIATLTEHMDPKIPQICAFELSLAALYTGDLAGTRDGFLRCIELNPNWSHAIYYFLAGCAELEIYREGVTKTNTEANRENIKYHKARADILFQKALAVIRKRLILRYSPFEQFIQYKIQKWEKRAKKLKLHFVDAIGISPLQEIIYLWNGFKKMRPEELMLSAGMLSWDRLTAPKDVAQKVKTEDDEAVRNVCLSAIYRPLDQLDKAKEACEKILKLNIEKYHYAQPAAIYEMAVLAWMDAQQLERRYRKAGDLREQLEIDRWIRTKMSECDRWLDRVTTWEESFMFETRIRIKVQTSKETLQWFKKEKGWEI
jgi:hypothetical protein